MSFLKKHIKTKNVFKDIGKITTTPNFYISESEENDALCNAFIELDAPFKMIKISHTGDCKPLETNYNGMSISSSTGKTYIINYNKVILEKDFLFSFSGIMEDVSSVKVFGWGTNSIYAKILNDKKMMPRNIEFDDNIVSDNSVEIKEGRNINKSINMYKFYKGDIGNNIIKGLHTDGDYFEYQGKLYKGFYHYNKATKKYMTGKSESKDSGVLNKVKPLRKEIKRIGRFK